MENIKASKKFIKSVSLTLTLMLIVTASLGYILDPNLYYRLSKFNTYYSEAYTTAGLMRNYPAEIAVIGSSMLQNTDMNIVKEAFGVEPIKYTRSGMNIDEIAMLIEHATSLKENRVNQFIVNLDISMFNTTKSSPYSKFPKYLYDNSILNDIKYLIGFETWTKFIPFITVYNAAKSIDNPIFNKVSSSFAASTDLKSMGDWSHGTKFGEEIVKAKFINQIESVSQQKVDNMLERMKTRFDNDLYPLIQKNQDKQFTFILPPYSALYWLDAEQKGYANFLYDFKKYMVIQLSQLSNVVVQDFQDYSEIVDLNNYKDTTHYIPEFNDLMIQSLPKSTYIIDENNVDQRISSLQKQVAEFKTANMNWIN